MLARRANLELPKTYRTAAGDSGENKNRLYEVVAWAENEYKQAALKG